MKSLEDMSFDEIRALRELYPDQQTQNLLAPLDRQSYVRQLTVDQGPMAGLLPALGSPVFELMKLLSPSNMGSRSEPSMDNAMAGLFGYGQGLKDWNKSKVTTKVRQPVGLLPYTEPDLPSISTRATPMVEFMNRQANEPTSMQDIIKQMKERKENKDLAVDKYLMKNDWML